MSPRDKKSMSREGRAPSRPFAPPLGRTISIPAIICVRRKRYPCHRGKIRAIVGKAVGRNLPQNTLNGQRPSLNTQNVLGRAGSRNSVSSVCREMRPGPVDQCPAGKKQHKGNRLADRERSHRGTRIAAQHLDAEADAGISHQIAPKNQTRRPLPETPIEEETVIFIAPY